MFILSLWQIKTNVFIDDFYDYLMMYLINNIGEYYVHCVLY